MNELNISENLDKYLNILTDTVIEFMPKLIGAGILLWIGFKVIKKINNIIAKSLKKMQISETMQPFLSSLLSNFLKIILLFIAVSIVGIQLSGLVTIVAAMGFAIGISLQGSLGNFASGILILFLNPYKVNDWIQVDDKFGKVEEIGIFNTVLVTPGNKTLIVPNSKITDAVVTNLSKKGIVRLELNIHIPYSEDFPKVKDIILKELKGITSLHHDIAPEIGIESFDSHSIVLAVRPFTEPDNFWQAKFDTHQAIKNAFNNNDIKVAYSEGIELGKIGK